MISGLCSWMCFAIASYRTRSSSFIRLSTNVKVSVSRKCRGMG